MKQIEVQVTGGDGGGKGLFSAEDADIATMLRWHVHDENGRLVAEVRRNGSVCGELVYADEVVAQRATRMKLKLRAGGWRVACADENPLNVTRGNLYIVAGTGKYSGGCRLYEAFAVTGDSRVLLGYQLSSQQAAGVLADALAEVAR